MGINIRTKGQTGERDVAKMLNAIVAEVREDVGYPPHDKQDEPFQRNQNQSAVGGADLSNPMSLEIEVKRQESLSVNSWWKQTILSAARTSGVPILIYRQSRKPWKIIMTGMITIKGGYHYETRVEITIAEFKKWFAIYYKWWLLNA